MRRRPAADCGETKGLWDWNLETNRVFFSPRWLSMVGCEEHEVGNSPDEWLRRVHPDDRERVDAWVSAHLSGSPCEAECQHRLLHKDGTYRWMTCRGLTVRGEKGRAVRLAGSHVDITADRVADPLTGLPNRSLLVERLANSIQRGKRHSDFLYALLLLDIDRFKTATQRLGAAGADQLLIAVARRLETCLRAGDTVARLGRDHVLARVEGDRFTILLDGLNETGDAKKVADRLLQEISAPFRIAGHEVFLTASIGIALSATGYNDPEEPIRDADIAVYRAKSLGKARCEVFDTAVLASAEKRRQIEIDLGRALAQNEFVLAFQPIVSLATHRVVAFEALVRWNHPTRGLVPPMDFIPAAEETGLITSIGRWVLAEACRQTREWQGRFPELCVSVNLSGVQFHQPSLVKEIEECLSTAGLAPRHLILELTERAIMQNPEAVTSTLLQLRARGVQVAIDDFGTGYSSLSYLRQFPVDYLKIDRFFVMRLENSQDMAEVVRTVANLSHQLGLRVIAEGIENTEQLRFVQSLSCEYGQGFLIAKPVFREAAEKLIDQEFTTIPQSSGGLEDPASVPIPGRTRRAADRWRLKSRRRAAFACLLAAVLVLVSVVAYRWMRSRPASGELSSAGPQPAPVLQAPAAVVAEAVVPPPASAPAEVSAPKTPPPTASAPKPASRKQQGVVATVPASVQTPRKQQEVSPHLPAPPPAPVKHQEVGTPVPPPEPASKVRQEVAAPAPVQSFAVVHDHVFGNCQGTLQVAKEALSFVSDKEKDSFRLEHGTYSILQAGDWLTVRSPTRSYKFRSAAAQSKSENATQLEAIARMISSVRPATAPPK